MTDLTRRGFLKALGVGAVTVSAGGILLAEAEPVRRFWQVGSAIRTPRVYYGELIDRDIVLYDGDRIEDCVVTGQVSVDRDATGVVIVGNRFYPDAESMKIGYTVPLVVA